MSAACASEEDGSWDSRLAFFTLRNDPSTHKLAYFTWADGRLHLRLASLVVRTGRPAGLLSPVGAEIDGFAFAGLRYATAFAVAIL